MNNSEFSLIASSAAINLNYSNVTRFHKIEKASYKTTDRRLPYTLYSQCSQSKTVGSKIRSLRFQELAKKEHYPQATYTRRVQSSVFYIV